MNVIMRTFYFPALLLSVSIIKSVYGQQMLPSNVKTEPQSCKQSFSTVLYTLLKEAGIFNQVFDVSLSPCRAALAYYRNAVAFAYELSDLTLFPPAMEVSQAAEEAFKKPISQIAYFHVFSDTTQEFLSRKGVLTPSTACQLALSYFDAILEAFQNLSDSTSPETSVDILEQSGANFLHELFHHLSSQDVKDMMLLFADNLLKAAGSPIVTAQPTKAPENAAPPKIGSTIFQPDKSSTDFPPELGQSTNNLQNNGITNDQPKKKFLDYQPTEMLPGEQPTEGLPDKEEQPSNGFPNGQLTGGLPDEQPNYGFPDEQPSGGLTGEQPTGGLPSEQPNYGFPDEQPSGGLTGEQPTGGLPSEQPTGGLPSEQPNYGFPDEQPNYGFPEQQPNYVFPDEMPSNGFPGEQLNKGRLDEQPDYNVAEL